MNKAIEQKNVFKGATAADLFDIFVNPKKHSAIHGGATTKITNKEGQNFSLLNGNLNGRNLLIVPNRMIVQAWRGNVWGKDDLDSVLILVFSDTRAGGQIEMVHAFTPEQFTELWNEVYWQPIREFIKQGR
ncbi:MAG TPA: SRPBCC domain-containing protein [Chitinophagaceae bacterium]